LRGLELCNVWFPSDPKTVLALKNKSLTCFGSCCIVSPPLHDGDGRHPVFLQPTLTRPYGLKIIDLLRRVVLRVERDFSDLFKAKCTIDGWQEAIGLRGGLDLEGVEEGHALLDPLENLERRGVLDAKPKGSATVNAPSSPGSVFELFNKKHVLHAKALLAEGERLRARYV
jgi:hypothetical protein